MVSTPAKQHHGKTSNRTFVGWACTVLGGLLVSLYNQRTLLSSLHGSERRTLLLEQSQDIPHAPGVPAETSPSATPPQFIFGFSTGHSGSTTTHRVLERLLSQGCSWNGTFQFEKKVEGEETWKFDPKRPCHSTETILLPHLNKLRRKLENNGTNVTTTTTWVDMGHYHNRLDHLECFAKLLQSEVAFVRIRRNRYAIARSFAAPHQSPCRVASDKPGLRPVLSYCPHSHEQHYNGPVALPVPSDRVWEEELTPFQRFLWLADDMEYRWHLLKQQYNNSNYKRSRSRGGGGQNEEKESSPQFYEFSWAQSSELAAGIQRVSRELGCDNIDTKSTAIPSVKRHVRHDFVHGIVHCKHQIQADLDYRRKMNFTAEQEKVLFREHPQPLSECLETPQELVAFLQSMDTGDDEVAASTDLKHWRILSSSKAADGLSLRANQAS